MKPSEERMGNRQNNKAEKGVSRFCKKTSPTARFISQFALFCQDKN
jgi:hypothetical protein